MARRLGIFGGTFNPPHIGHLLCAQDVLETAGLDAVVFMPVFQPPHKQVADEPGAQHRLALCELAVRDDDRFEVSPVEVERGGPSYTVDTLRELHASAPEDELTFIAGGDVVAGLPSWKEPEEVLALARFAVTERRGVKREDVAARVAGVAGAGRIAFFGMPRVDISSSDIRRRVAERRPIRYLVGQTVEAYIAEHGLYRAAVAAG